MAEIRRISHMAIKGPERRCNFIQNWRRSLLRNSIRCLVSIWDKYTCRMPTIQNAVCAECLSLANSLFLFSFYYYKVWQPYLSSFASKTLSISCSTAGKYFRAATYTHKKTPINTHFLFSPVLIYIRLLFTEAKVSTLAVLSTLKSPVVNVSLFVRLPGVLKLRCLTRLAEHKCWIHYREKVL